MSGRTKRFVFRMLSSVCAGCSVFDLQTYLGVLHHTLDAVEVREVTDRLAGIVQHSPDSLGEEATSELENTTPMEHAK